MYGKVFGLISILIAFVFFGSGCVSSSFIKEMSSDIESLKTRVTDLEKRVATQESTLAGIQQATPTPDSEMESDSEAEESIAIETPSPKSSEPGINPPKALGSAEMFYSRGRNDYHDGKYREAVTSFRQAELLTDSPELKARSLYWIGECYYSQKSYRRALEIFQKISRDYPHSSKAPDALVKIGFTYYEINEYNKSMQALEEFLREYPDHRAAGLVQDKLHEIQQIKTR